MNPSDVQVFVRVVRAGSFSDAAERLGITRSAVSKAVARLEADLQVVLLRRTPRSLSMTDAGARFFRFADEADQALQSGKEAVSGSDEDVAGHLAVTLPTSFGAAFMAGSLRRFRSQWPKLTLNLNFDDRPLDLISGGFDLAIRCAARLEDSNLRSKALASSREILAASPGYLARFGTPRHVNDLENHRCLDLGRPMRTEAVWRFTRGNDPIEVSVALSLTTNSELALILAACLDEGILHTPALLIGGELASGRLVEILDEFTDAREWGVHAVYPQRKPPAKVKAFIEFITAEMDALEKVDHWTPFDRID